jgi:hypothetical protein
MPGRVDLSTLNPNVPSDKENPDLGASRERETRLSIINSFSSNPNEGEHYLTGEHMIPTGPIANRPAAGYPGRFYIQTVLGQPTDLYYDNGTSWIGLTSGPAIVTLTAALATHAAKIPIDHPDTSVTSSKIPNGAIIKGHLDGTTDTTNISALVDGGYADALHSHNWSGIAAVITDGSIAPQKLTGVTPGATPFGVANAQRVQPLQGAAKVKEIKVLITGTFTCITVAANGIPGTPGYTQIYKNSVPIGNYNSYNNSVYTDTPIPGTTLYQYQAYSEDLGPFAVGDLIQLYATQWVSVSNFQLNGQWFVSVTLN